LQAYKYLSRHMIGILDDNASSTVISNDSVLGEFNKEI
jgi:hypothetical protein